MAEKMDEHTELAGQAARGALKAETLLLLLIAIVSLQTIASAGLFLRMNQLQREVLAAVRPLQTVQSSSGRPQGLQTGIQSPSFALLDTQGRTTRLEDFAGRKVLLAFSSVRCSPCSERYPDLKLLSEQSQSVQIVLVCQGSLEENQELVETQRFSFPVLMWDETIAREYRIPGTPYFYVIDGRGIIVSKGFVGGYEQLSKLVGIAK